MTTTTSSFASASPSPTTSPSTTPTTTTTTSGTTTVRFRSLSGSSSSSSSTTTITTDAASPSSSSTTTTTTTITTTTTPFLRRCWESYGEAVRANHRTLDNLDDVISRILFWLPHRGGDDDDDHDDDDGHRPPALEAAWREVGYGMLSLQRLAMHLALSEVHDENENENQNHHHGMSIRTRDPSSGGANARRLRIGLTALHSVLPALMSLAVHRVRNSSRRRDSAGAAAAAAAAKIRLMVEVAKFGLRLALLGGYWTKQLRSGGDDDDAGGGRCPGTGILLDGGFYRPSSCDPQDGGGGGMPWWRAAALRRRLDYRGARTGWTASGKTASTTTTTITTTEGRRRRRRRTVVKTILADLLHAARPLLWARCEFSHLDRRNRSWYTTEARRLEPTGAATSPWSPARDGGGGGLLLRGWILCLAMDVLSLRLLNKNDDDDDDPRSPPPNAASSSEPPPPPSMTDPWRSAEIRRRRFRLLLHLLRPPVWRDGGTRAAVTAVSERILQKVPILGPVLSAALWDWILYHKHPYVAEEG